MNRLLLALGLIGVSSSLATAQTRAPSSSPLTHCVYNNRIFSPGAIICISKSHHQQCIAGKMDRDAAKTVAASWGDAKAVEVGCSASWPETAISRQTDN